MTLEVRTHIKEQFELHKSQGNKAYTQGDFDGALRHYIAAIESDPHNTTQMVHVMKSNIAAVHASASEGSTNVGGRKSHAAGPCASRSATCRSRAERRSRAA